MLCNQPIQPERGCNKCSRLHQYSIENGVKYPSWHNGPVNSFGNINSELLIVGLAPGLKGANRTGIPFLGDDSGNVLYTTLQDHGLAKGQYNSNCLDNFVLINCRITNVVRCLPPKNRPIGAEIKNCSKYLFSEINSMPNLKIILALGIIAHRSVITIFQKRQLDYQFSHNVFHKLNNIWLANSYHCSRYNTNTRRLTKKMFHAVFKGITKRLK